MIACKKILRFIPMILAAATTYAGTPAAITYMPDQPENFFIEPGSAKPLRIRLSEAPKTIAKEQLSYHFRDYSGQTVASGKAEYDAEQHILSLQPPQNIGYYDIILPELGIHAAAVVDTAPPRNPDEFFGIDGSFGWGGAPFKAEDIRSYLRILKKNGIVWNRDRIGWWYTNPIPGKYVFKDMRENGDGLRFERYHFIAAEEGIKTLDTFHDTPPFVRNPTTSNPKDFIVFPKDYTATGRSWNDIIRHWKTIQALEVWNEAEGATSIPAEFLAAFTKAMSHELNRENPGCKVVGGVMADLPGRDINYYNYLLKNGILDDCDAFSYHAYGITTVVETLVIQMRNAELVDAPDRAGIPLWITESGTPWTKGDTRAIVEDDKFSAVEIVGKAIEYRALGIERFFAFSFKYYNEPNKRFGMMDRNFFPMRSMAAYTHLTRVLSGREYIGDLDMNGLFGARRRRVFSDGETAVAVLYCGVREHYIPSLDLPAALPAPLKITGLDGRVLAEAGDRRIPLEDGIAYVYFREEELRPFLNTDTQAMKCYRLARAFKHTPRAAKPLVLQPDYQLEKFKHKIYGLDLEPGKPYEFQVKLNNLGDKPLVFQPELTLPEGIEKVSAESAPIDLSPGDGKPFRFTIKMNEKFPTNSYRYLKLQDKAGAATPLVISIRKAQVQEKAVALPFPPEPELFAETTNPTLENWTEFSSEGYHKLLLDSRPIEARFRVFYRPDTLQLQVLVKDPVFSCPFQAADAWEGDSVQFSLQKRDAAGTLPSDRKFHEFTAARSQDGEQVYRHIGGPAGIDRQVKLRLVELPPDRRCYIIDVPAAAIGIEKFDPGISLGFSIAINNNDKSGRSGYLPWGGGIVNGKLPAEFNLLTFKQ